MDKKQAVLDALVCCGWVKDDFCGYTYYKTYVSTYKKHDRDAHVYISGADGKCIYLKFEFVSEGINCVSGFGHISINEDILTQVKNICDKVDKAIRESFFMRFI